MWDLTKLTYLFYALGFLSPSYGIESWECAARGCKFWAKSDSSSTEEIVLEKIRFQ